MSCKKGDGNDKNDKVSYDLSAYNALSEPERANCAELGLGVFWGIRNLGAEASSKYGNYYAWGEKAPKENGDDYDWDHYYYRKDNKINKYNTADGLTTLEAADDAVHNYDDYKVLGDKWRMPPEPKHLNPDSLTKGYRGYFMGWPI